MVVKDTRSTVLKDEIRIIAQKHRWAMEELVTDRKMQEANALCSDRSAKPMYDYLLSEFGDLSAVVGALRAVVIFQRKPAKSLALNSKG